MTNSNRRAFAALATAGGLWGLTVPLSKLALAWLGPGWLTVARFAVAAPLLALVARRDLRAAATPRIVAAGALGFGAVIVLQNAGIAATSISHAAVIVGIVPLLVALIGVGHGGPRTGRRSWAGYGLALGGIALVAGSSGGGATTTGDLLVLGSAALSAVFITAQSELLDDQNPAAVTAVQFIAGAVIAVPFALLDGGLPSAPVGSTPVLALAALGTLGTLLPFWLFAWGQARVSARLAGAFVNLEPVIGAALGWLAFANPAGVEQIAGAVGVLTGIALSVLPAAGAPERDTPGQASRPSVPGSSTGQRLPSRPAADRERARPPARTRRRHALSTRSLRSRAASSAQPRPGTMRADTGQPCRRPHGRRERSGGLPSCRPPREGQPHEICVTLADDGVSQLRQPQ